MPIIVTAPGPDGTLQTVPEPAPDAAPPPGEGGDPGASAPPPDETAAPEPAAPAPSESAPDVPDRPEPTEEDDDEVPGLPKGVQRRIDRLTRQREEARREAAAIKARLEMLEQGYRRPPQEPEPVPLHQQPEPREEDYPSQQEWFTAVRAWDKAQLKAELAREQAEARTRQAQAAQQAQLVAQAQAARQKYADFDAVLDRLRGLYTAPALDACVHESDLGAELAYYLAQHPEEITRLNEVAQTRPLAMAREIGKLELRLSPPPPGPTGTPSRPTPPTPKPAPPTPLSGSGSPGPRRLTDMSEEEVAAMSQREFEALYQRQFPGSR